MKLKNLKRILWVLAVLGIMPGARAQGSGIGETGEMQSVSIETCGTDVLHSKLMEDPKYSRSFMKVQNSFKANRIINSEKVLPIVVHIIHSGQPYGQFPHIPESEVNEVIDNINQKFEGSNANLSLCIAGTSTSGEIIDGIQYHDINDIYPNWEGASVYDYYGSVINAIAYDPNNYINVYVAQWSGNPQGFSWLPPTNYGTWVKATQFVDLYSDTFIHELGHYCGLAHTFSMNLFGANYGSCEQAAGESSCETQGDRVCDTPATPVNWSCTTPACPELNADLDNYMDYVPDNCSDSFTPGQVDRMHSQLEQYRESLLENTICIDVDYDLSIYEVENLNTECNTIFHPNVIVKNYGISGNYVFTVDMEIVDSNQTTIYQIDETISMYLEEGEEVAVELDEIMTQYGIYEANFTLDYAFDEWLSNNQFSQTLDFNTVGQLSMDLNLGTFPTIQWKLYIDDFNPNTSSGSELIASCNWGGPVCWDSYYNGGAPIFNFDYCLPAGCYQLKWRYTSNSNLNICWNEEPCYVYVYLSNGDTLISDVGQVDGPSTVDYYFCIEEEDPCPIYECPWDLDDDGVVDVRDLVELLQVTGMEGECIRADFDGNGIVGAMDVTLFLQHFGYECSTGTLVNDNLSIVEILDSIENTILIESYLVDLMGRRVNDKGRLEPGIYIIVSKWKGGVVTTQKIYRFQ